MSDQRKHLDQLRIEYSKKTLSKAEAQADPIAQFDVWFEEGRRSELPDLNVVQLATVHEDQPSSRVVLLHSFDQKGFVFFTNYQSEKGLHIAQNPKVALTFFWWQLERQVRIEGLATKVPAAVSDAYFASRPRESQIGAWASAQSIDIAGRAALENKYAAINERFKEADVPRPEHWGGYQVAPHRIEFWQGREGRLHDRLLYTKREGDWTLKRLQP